MLDGRPFDDAATLQRPKRSRSSTEAIRAEVLSESESGRARCSRLKKGPGSRGRTSQIVGVVKDTKYTDLREEFMPLAFFPTSQEAEPDSRLQVVMRSAAPLLDDHRGGLSGGRRRSVPSIDHAVPDDGVAGARLAAARAADGDAVGILRRPRGTDRDHRPLRRHVLHGRAAEERDRDPDGARRRPRACRQDGDARGRGAARGRASSSASSSRCSRRERQRRCCSVSSLATRGRWPWRRRGSASSRCWRATCRRCAPPDSSRPKR